MRYGSILTYIMFCIFFTEPALAQQQIFKNYTVNDGLISNSVRSIYQDSKGFLWIATWEGLSKYDGHSFTNFSTANGLSHSFVNDFYETKDGSLLIFLNNKTIDRIKGNTIFKNAIATTATVNQIIASANHNPILSTDGQGLQELRDEKIVRPKQAFSSRTYYDLVWLNDSVLIAASDSSVTLFNSSYSILAEIKRPGFAYAAGKIYKDASQQIWLGSSNAVHILKGLPDKKHSTGIPFFAPYIGSTALQQKKINAIFQDDDGNRWFGTNAGLVKISVDGSQQLITVKDGIASNIINCIFQDREKNIWLGTAVGLSKLVTRSGISLYPVENGIYTSDNLYLLYPSKKNQLLVSTIHGAQVFNKSTGSFTPIANGKNEIFFNHVQNSQPPLLIGGFRNVLFDSSNNRYVSIPVQDSKGASRIITDKKGNHFCGNLQQLFYCSGTSSLQILSHRISSLLIDKQGDLWAGTWQNGLYRIKYQVNNNQLEILVKEHYMPTENIRCMFEDSQGNIWAGTRYNGIYRFVRKQNSRFDVYNFDQSKGLTSNFIKGITEDKKGNFWIAFYQGLDKLIPAKNGFHIFNFSRVNNFYASMVGMYADADNSLWLATGEGLAHIKDGELEKATALPVYITSVKSGDTSLLVGEQIQQLNYHQKQLAFEYSSPGFINEKQVMYSYRLVENAEKNWSSPSNQHAVSYANLQPGNYLFEVRTLGWNGEWGKPASFAFSISPAMWQTWWFRSIAIAVLAMLVFLLLKKRIKTVRHEAEMKQKIAETEMMALRAQMNPHFIFNCLNSIDNLIQLDEKEKATLYLSKFAKLIRSILENSGNNTVPCWKDMETMQLYLELEALRFDHKFGYQVNIAPEILNGDYKVPPLVIQPFLENAIHHGLLNKVDGNKKLTVDVQVSPDHIHYYIEDNGIGRSQAVAYRQHNKLAYGSMGIHITEERIHIFNEHSNTSVKIDDLFDENNQPIGTKVFVSLLIKP